MSLADRFLSEVWRAVDQPGGEDALTPAVLVRACRAVLPIDGAGITMTGQVLRLPLGASDEATALVEQVQATLGDGPCMDAMADNLPLVAGPATMTRCWPAYTSRVFDQTSFRSVAVTPLAAPGHAVFGALSLYSATARLGDLLDIVEVQREIGDLIAGILSSQLAGDAFENLTRFTWLQTDAVTHRRQVWMAVGIIAATAKVSPSTALDVLRASARRQEATLDAVAQRLFAEYDHPGVLASAE